MVQISSSAYIQDDGSINLNGWLHHFYQQRDAQNFSLVREACFLSQLAGENQPTFTGQSCLQQGLFMAEILADLNQDQECLAAAIINDSVYYGDLSFDIVRDQLGENVEKLLKGARQMDASSTLHNKVYNPNQTENVRMMLLAMVEDVRVVLIKLAERICVMRNVDVLGSDKQQQISEESLEIYAPLANRLGATSIKWELEDRAFRFLNPEQYKNIATLLDGRRLDRERFIKETVAFIEQTLDEHKIHDVQVSGRVKHIYGIHRKMQRKHISYDEVYDASAIRVLVPSIEDCYQVLSIVHDLWQQIPEEFDDYIATPKPNGYRSIHTAIIGPEKKNIEIQVRTYEMHHDCELGVAAHWIYKENKQQNAAHEAKIAWLRQVLEWQQELSQQQENLEEQHAQIFDDRIYIFTPTGEILDLVQGATPLDFAYRVHTEVGHRCRGAKVNGNIVQLTHALKTGDQVEVLTTNKAHPSLDWLNPHLGYLKTSRAKAKVHQWFKQQNFDQNFEAGQQLFEQECKRLNLAKVDLDSIAQKYNYKGERELFAGLGCGDLRIAQIINAVQALQPKAPTTPILPPVKRPSTRTKASAGDVNIHGVGNLLTHIAKCCNPIPGDDIIGFITLGRGVSIHQQQCSNILHATEEQKQRIIEVEWQQDSGESYPIKIYLQSKNNSESIRTVSELLKTEKVHLYGLHHEHNQATELYDVHLSIAVTDLSTLSRLLNRLQQLPNILQVKRHA